MFELNEMELEFLDKMGVVSKGVMFTDKESGKIFLYVGKKVSYTPDRYGYPLKEAIAYECGDDAIVFIRHYAYVDKPFSKELWKTRSVIRVLRDGLWHNLEIEKGAGNTCSIALEPLSTNEDGVSNKNVTDKNEYYYYFLENDEMNFGFLNEGGFGLYINDHESLKPGAGVSIRCNGEAIIIESKPRKTIKFSYKNLVTVLEKCTRLANWEEKKDDYPSNIEIMCRVIIPSMLVQEIEEIKKKIAIKKQNGSSIFDDERKLAIFEKISEEFAKNVEKDKEDNYKQPLCKRFGETINK